MIWVIATRKCWDITYFKSDIYIYISKEILFKICVRERNQAECEKCYIDNIAKDIGRKNQETVQDLIREIRFTNNSPILLFYFNAAKGTKSEKSFWRFASRWCLPTKERKRERDRVGERKRKRVRGRIGNSREELKRIWRVWILLN